MSKPMTTAKEGLPAATCSLRPFESQSDLERTLRAHLWHPKTFLEEADERIKKAVKKGDYECAAFLKKKKISAKQELETWENLLTLYEEEFHLANAKTLPTEGAAQDS